MKTLQQAIVAVACVVLVLLALRSAAPLSDRERILADVVRRQTSEPLALFVHAGAELWYQPLAIYPSVVLLRAGLWESPALRLPSALAGVLTILLTYLLASRLTGSRCVATWAAVLLLILPGFIAQARAPGAELLVVPLVLGWLVAVVEHIARPRMWLSVVGGIALGACVYTQPSGVLAVPIYFVVGAVAMFRVERGSASIGTAALGVIAVTMPVAVWLVQHLDAYPDTFGRWAIHAAHIRNPWEGLVAFSRWHVMARRVGEYWHYFNPTFLFSREVLGVTALPLVALGGWALTATATTSGRWLLVVGILVSPLAAVLLDEPRSLTRSLLLLPFAAMLAAVGVNAVARVWSRVVPSTWRSRRSERNLSR